MSSNAPPFDPLNPTAAEDADMLAGYLEGRAGLPLREDASLAYSHGRRNGFNDRNRTSEPEQRALARQLLRKPPRGSVVG